MLTYRRLVSRQPGIAGHFNLFPTHFGGIMAKGIEKVKETKKKPALSLKEKRAKKKEKKTK